MMRPRERGFTLLEVLVALGLTALISISVATLVTGLVDARERLATPPPMRQHLHFAQLLERRLESLVVRPLHEGGQPRLNRPLDFQADTGPLEWVAASGWPLPLGDHYTRLRRQRLEWQPDIGELRLLSSGELDAAGRPTWHASSHLEGLERLVFSFHDGQQWRATPAPDGRARAVRLDWWQSGQRHGVVVPLPLLEAP
ncbi:prepilin-type N-terminal cleavage/methylation domain-containing protein [Halomonas sp. TRM85114]|uniref:PulJ/GspJ family protein n=1 Tax=Halomonas jincaotanensis TaxID=2810616 RepID=UPI001BD40C8F|nr:prepilin-type N-terminal cleavage/methylation domain-containing protein [Halomonas jincaotanensis]MBS9403127.1 prepilin-type N-terminal cleavage/methylation domain-containing protein [Halomonas jincaotanensis]